MGIKKILIPLFPLFFLLFFVSSCEKTEVEKMYDDTKEFINLDKKVSFVRFICFIHKINTIYSKFFYDFLKARFYISEYFEINKSLFRNFQKNSLNLDDKRKKLLAYIIQKSSIINTFMKYSSTFIQEPSIANIISFIFYLTYY